MSLSTKSCQPCFLSSRTCKPNPVRRNVAALSGRKQRLKKEKEDLANDDLPSPSTVAVETPAQPQAAPPVSYGSESSVGAVSKILLMTVLILGVIGAFYAAVFYGGTWAFFQFKDEISTITKKDFVPYSERLAMEQALRDSRAASAEAPTLDESVPAPVPAPAASEKDLMSLLPSTR